MRVCGRGASVRGAVLSNVKFPFWCDGRMTREGHENVIERCLMHREALDGATLRVDLVEQCAHVRAGSVRGHAKHSALNVGVHRATAEYRRRRCK
jgi:hypothetical protein